MFAKILVKDQIAKMFAKLKIFGHAKINVLEN